MKENPDILYYPGRLRAAGTPFQTRGRRISPEIFGLEPLSHHQFPGNYLGAVPGAVENCVKTASATQLINGTLVGAAPDPFHQRRLPLAKVGGLAPLSTASSVGRENPGKTSAAFRRPQSI